MTEIAGERWVVDDLTIDVGAQSVVRDGIPIILPQLSFKFLLTLIRASPNVLSIEALMEQVWTGIFVNSETVTQRAKLLRDALGDDPKSPRYFTVRRGSGYQLVPAPELLSKDEFLLSSAKRTSGWKTAVAALALGGVAVGAITAVELWPSADHVAAKSSVRVAVLPFDNLSSDPADAFIARSISEMVLNRLSTVQGLSLIARDSAGAASANSITHAARRLHARYVVKGSIQRTGDTLRVTCFVVDADQGVRLWSEQYDWPVNRLYALQDKIAERVASSLEMRTRGLGELAPAALGTRNSDAYLDYLRGKSLIGHFTVGETDSAAGYFERAVKLDPAFAPAMVALFDARMQAADLRKDDLGPVRARYQPFLERALLIDPNSGEALFAQAMWTNASRAERGALFRRAAALDPSNSRGLTAFAQFLGDGSNGGVADGNVTRDGENSTERKQLLDHVLAIDPLNPRARFVATMQKLGELTPAQLEAEQKRLLDLDPGNYALANRYASRRWMFHGETAEAIERMEKTVASDPQNPWGPHILAAFYLDANDLNAAQAAANSTPASHDSTRAIFAQFHGDWRTAGQAALGNRGFLFNRFTNWLWPETVRDYALRSGQYRAGAEAIATRYGFDLRNPRTETLAQSIAAPALGNILLASGDRQAGERLLAQTVQWLDAHPRYGLVGNYRTRAASMMLLGERDQALSDLKASIETGHDIRHWWYLIDRDPVWTPVRNDPRFRSIADFCRQAAHAQRIKLDELRRAGKVPTRSAVAGT